MRLEDYTDYRLFLKDRIEAELKTHPDSTLRKVALQMKVSASLLSMIMEGSRNLSEKHLFQVAHHLRLKGHSLELFESLVRWNQATTLDAEAWYKLRFQTLTEKKLVNSSEEPCPSPDGSLEVDFVTLPKQFQDWYVLPLFVYLKDFAKPFNKKVHLLEAANLFQISEEQVQSVLDRYQEQGVLDFSQENHVHIHVEKLGGSFSQKRFFQNLMTHMASVVHKQYDTKQSVFLADSVRVSEEGLARFVHGYKNLISELAESGTSSNLEPEKAKLYTLAVQAIPHI